MTPTDRARTLYRLIRARGRLHCREAMDALDCTATAVYEAVRASSGHLDWLDYGDVDISKPTERQTDVPT